MRIFFSLSLLLHAIWESCRLNEQMTSLSKQKSNFFFTTDKFYCHILVFDFMDVWNAAEFSILYSEKSINYTFNHGHLLDLCADQTSLKRQFFVSHTRLIFNLHSRF